MTLEYSSNPFATMLPGGSPSDRWANPPLVHLSGVPYLAMFYWDAAEMPRHQTPETLAVFQASGVVGQSIMRAADGSEYYVRIYANRVELIPTGFRGAAFKPPTTEKPNTQETNLDMTHLARLKRKIVGLYADDPGIAEDVQTSLAECATLRAVKSYLAATWDTATFNRFVEEFFGEQEGDAYHSGAE